MFQAMIVEDNAIYRYAVRTILHWEDYGFEIVAEALNGKHALELLKVHPVDLILTDISMPEMNGIDFIQAVKQIDSSIHIVALSSYDDFQFVKEALKLGADDYLLKHELEPDSLRLLLQQMYTRVNEDKKKRVEAGYNHSNLTAMIAMLGKKLLLGEITNRREMEEQAAAVQFPIGNHPIIVVTVGYKPSAEELAPKLTMEAHKLETELVRLTSEMMSYLIIPISDHKACVIAYFLKEKGETLIFSEAYHAASIILTSQLRENSIASLGISSVGYGIKDLHLLYKQSEDALAHTIYEGSGKIFRNDSLPQTVDMNSDSMINQLAIAMKSGDLIEVERQAELLFSYLQEQKPHIPELRQVLVDLFALLKFLANEKNVQQAQMKHWHHDLLKAIELLQPIQLIKSLFLETCRELLGGKIDKSVSRKEIQMVMDYIHLHYAEDITIRELSKVLCLNTNYLSNLFRQETGLRIIEYLNRHRIEMATKLLRDPRLKVYEVAERTGFQDTSYFCKVFKEIEGTTVTDYKRQVEHH